MMKIDTVLLKKSKGNLEIDYAFLKNLELNEIKNIINSICDLLIITLNTDRL